jgi:hypothetical protein
MMMQRRRRVTLMDDRNQCPQCGRSFRSIADFDRHRIGSFTLAQRHCMTEDEMKAAGMVKNTAGLWMTEKPRKHAMPSLHVVA